MRCVSSSVLFLCAICPASVAGPEEQAAPGQTALDTHSYWRCFLGLSEPVVKVGDKLPGADLAVPGPPAGWTEPEFDDTGWGRVPGPFFPGQYQAGFVRHERSAPDLALLCLRGRFAVRDPAAVRKLTLALTFRGGVVVHLNGEEVGRAHLPQGKIDPSTLAEDYPKEAFVKPDGKIILWGWREPEKFSARIALRTRTLRGLSIPTKLLRKGQNVLAIEIHRAAYHEVCLLGDKKQFYGAGRGRTFGPQSGSAWTTCGLTSLSLKAEGSGLLSCAGCRPKGLEVWTPNPMQAVFDVDFGDLGERPGAIRLVGTRNGAFSGQVVVSSDARIEKPSAAISDLKHQDGRGTIPASAIQVRYALPGSTEENADGRYPGGLRGAQRFDALAEAPPHAVEVRTKRVRDLAAKPIFGAVQPIWITVNVPPDAPPGEYRGTLAISVAGAEAADVPVRIDVCPWRLPDPQNYQTFVDFIQSPETVAMHYKVPLWSARHFELIGRSFRLLGQAGSKVLYIPLVCKTHFGNAQSMVRWVKKQPAGHEHDFSIVEKYLDCAEKHVGRPAVVVLYVIERYMGPGRSWGRGERDPLKWRSALVTEVDPATGKVTELQAPKFTTPQNRAFWEPVIKGLRQRLARRGYEKAMMLGIRCDFNWITKEMVEFFKTIAPGVPWVDQGHGPAKAIFGVPVGYASAVWGARGPRDPAAGRTYGWQNPWLLTHFHRNLLASHVLTECRLTAEWNLAGRQRGIGRLGGDFWPVIEGPRGRTTMIAGRYPSESNWGQLRMKTTFLAPGPNGAIATVRFEVLREGIQECEARILIEQALQDAGQRAKLGEALARRCQDILDERTRAVLRSGVLSASTVMGYHWFVSSGWQERSRALYCAAAAVAARLAGAEGPQARASEGRDGR